MTRFERVFVWVATLLTFASGGGYFWTKYLVDPNTAWAVVNHPLQPWFLRVHVLAAPLLVFAIGGVTFRHVWHQLRAGGANGRRTGLVTATCATTMILTGYLIQVITSVGWLKAMAYSHIALGTIYVLAFVTHELLGGRRARVGRAVAAGLEAGRKEAGAWEGSFLERRRHRAGKEVTAA